MTATIIRGYTSSVLAVGPSIWCAIVTVVVTALAFTVTRAPPALTSTVIIVIAALVSGFVSTTTRVRVMAKPGEVSYRVGFGRWRTFHSSHLQSVECVDVGAAAIVGIGIPPSRTTARHIVRSGLTLHVNIVTGEQVWLSISSPLPDDLICPTAINKKED